MLNYINPPVLYLGLTAIISSIIAVYAWRNPQTRGNRAFAAGCAAAILWMIGDVIGRLADSPVDLWIGTYARYIGIFAMPVTLFVFINQYCGKKTRHRTIVFLSVVPVVSLLMLITNPSHNLFLSNLTFNDNGALIGDFGAYFRFVHLPFSFGLLLTGFVRILIELNRASSHYRKQIAFLLGSLLVPFGCSIVGVFLSFPNLTPLSLPVFFLVTAYAIFRHQFLGSNPIAYETVFKTIQDGVLVLDRHDIIRDVNPAALNGFGKQMSELVGMRLGDALKDWESAVEIYEKNPAEMGEIEVNLFGSTRFLSIESTSFSGGTEGRILTIRDNTDKYAHQRSLESLAFHDPLTRLANRHKFQEEFEIAIRRADELNQPVALLYFDLNRFKAVNDSFGHEVGDELLKYVAARVASILRKPDLLARLGGDEFGIILHKCDKSGVDLIVDRILDNVQRPFRVGENSLVASLSIGAACYPEDGTSLTELLRHADAAMYRAKHNGNRPPSIELDSANNLAM